MMNRISRFSLVALTLAAACMAAPANLQAATPSAAVTSDSAASAPPVREVATEAVPVRAFSVAMPLGAPISMSVDTMRLRVASGATAFVFARAAVIPDTILGDGRPCVDSVNQVYTRQLGTSLSGIMSNRRARIREPFDSATMFTVAASRFSLAAFAPIRPRSEAAQRSTGSPADPFKFPLGLVGLAGMTALAKERDTVKRDGGRRSYDVAANAKIYQGSIVMLDAGYAKAGAAAVGKIALGRACQTIDNTGGAAGAQQIEVEFGEFNFGNSAAGDAIARGDIGADCYIADDQTVAKTDNSGARSRAGKITGVDAQGVWVAIGIGL